MSKKLYYISFCNDDNGGWFGGVYVELTLVEKRYPLARLKKLGIIYPRWAQMAVMSVPPGLAAKIKPMDRNRLITSKEELALAGSGECGTVSEMIAAGITTDENVRRAIKMGQLSLINPAQA